MICFQRGTVRNQRNPLAAWNLAVVKSTCTNVQTCTNAVMWHVRVARRSCVQCPSSTRVARLVCGTQAAHWTCSSSHPVEVSWTSNRISNVNQWSICCKWIRAFSITPSKCHGQNTYIQPDSHSWPECLNVPEQQTHLNYILDDINNTLFWRLAEQILKFHWPGVML